jgi:hypothetical protein
MSTAAVILVVVAAVFVLFFIGGYVATTRRRRRPSVDAAIASADRALAHAQASDRGWDRAVLDAAAQQALADLRPDFEWETLQLVLVDDRPGVEEDRAHLRASGATGIAVVVLQRSAEGDWSADRVE